jgi:hypothetical protein
MSKILLNENRIKNNILSLNPKPKIITVRKPINKIMNLDNFFTKNKISKSPKIFSKNSINYSKKAYISPTISSLTNNNTKKYSKNNSPSKIRYSINSNKNKNKNSKYVGSKISPVKRKYNFLQHNIKNELYVKTNNNNNNKNITEFKTNEKAINKNHAFNFKKKSNSKKKNYKDRILINKKKLSKNLDNNLIFSSLIDYESSDNNCSSSVRGKEKIKQYLNEDKKEDQNKDNAIKCEIGKDIFDINNKDMLNILMSNNSYRKKKGDNCINSTYVLDVGSISHISKNGSISIKEKNMEDETKTNNKEFEKIINDLIGEDNCKNLFIENKKNTDNDNIIKEDTLYHQIVAQ